VGDTVKVKQFSRKFFHVKNPAGVFSAVMLPQVAKFRNGFNGWISKIFLFFYRFHPRHAPSLSGISVERTDGIGNPRRFAFSALSGFAAVGRG
jgi:hypothetical protein